jgi:uncharacterized RmlC-like cupin family protein
MTGPAIKVPPRRDARPRDIPRDDHSAVGGFGVGMTERCEAARRVGLPGGPGHSGGNRGDVLVAVEDVLLTRQEAVAAGALWSGLASLAPGARTGWHHHGQHETSLYVLSGTVRLEFGPAGSRVLDCGPGDFVYVPGGTVHRESNPGSTGAVTVMTRAGEGDPMYEVGDPATDRQSWAPCREHPPAGASPPGSRHHADDRCQADHELFRQRRSAVVAVAPRGSPTPMITQGHRSDPGRRPGSPTTGGLPRLSASYPHGADPLVRLAAMRPGAAA